MHPGCMGDKKAAVEPGHAASAQPEALADQRERKADEREREADRREAALTRRQQETDERERALQERARRLGADFLTLEQRTLAAIKRSRALLALSEQRLDRREPAVKQVAAGRDRHQAEVAASEREQAARLPDPSKRIERAKVLRKWALATFEAFAANEEEIARIHEELAARRPERRDEYQCVAEQARAAARRARAVLRAFTA